MTVTHQLFGGNRYGEVEEMNVCDNLGDHLVGNVYIKFRTEEDASKAVAELNNRWFGGRPIYAELSPVTDFREACCRKYSRHPKIEPFCIPMVVQFSLEIWTTLNHLGTGQVRCWHDRCIRNHCCAEKACASARGSKIVTWISVKLGNNITVNAWFERSNRSNSELVFEWCRAVWMPSDAWFQLKLTIQKLDLSGIQIPTVC